MAAGPLRPSRVVVHNSTPHWATLTVTGPRSRDLVAGLDLGVDLADAALPHMAFADGRFQGRPVRVARVSFTGDRSYEISVPSSQRAGAVEGDERDRADVRWRC